MTDYPGFGDRPRDSLMTLLADLYQMVMGCCRRGSTGWSQSMGCVLALRATVEDPARVRRLVLGPPAGSMSTGGVPGIGAVHGGPGDRMRPLGSLTMALVRVGAFLRGSLVEAALRIVPGGTHDRIEERPELVATLTAAHLGS
ncbi:MAG: alpha/beta fold hydrolase [Acidiferrobacter sp.]